VPTLAGVESRIRELVDRHRPELERIVDVELDRALDAIVVERIIARNGHVPDRRDHQDPDRQDGEPAKLCTRCHQAPALRGRRVCQHCKGSRDWQRQRERQAIAGTREIASATVDAEEPPRPVGL
jgi:hypothetical protein